MSHIRPLMRISAQWEDFLIIPLFATDNILLYHNKAAKASISPGLSSGNLPSQISEFFSKVTRLRTYGDTTSWWNKPQPSVFCSVFQICRNSLCCCAGTFKLNSFSGSQSGCQVVVASFILDFFFLACHVCLTFLISCYTLFLLTTVIVCPSLIIFASAVLTWPSMCIYSKCATSPVFANLLSVLQLIFHGFLDFVFPFCILDFFPQLNWFHVFLLMLWAPAPNPHLIFGQVFTF